MKGRQRSKNFVKHRYIPLKRRYRSRKGLSERLIKKRLEKKGWIVWRAGFIDAIRYAELYPNVEKKYTQLCWLLKRCGHDLEFLQYMSRVNHGMPDFICYRKSFKFVECKLGHEQLSRVQKKCILRLTQKGFRVEVIKMVFPCTKDRISLVNLKNGEKRVLEKQMRLKTRW